MQTLPDDTRPDQNLEKIYKQIESSSRIVQSGWKDISTTIEGYISTIDKANKSIDLVDYLDTRLEMEYIPSNNGWNYRLRCPFHKHGDERTPSMFISKEQNRFYCQACGKTGGIVDYLAFKFKRPPISVAKNILYCMSENFVIDDTAVKKSNERKKYQKNMLQMSEMYQKFVKKYFTDSDAMEYINKCYFNFDKLLIQNTESVEKNFEELIKQFKLYIHKYEEKERESK